MPSRKFFSTALLIGGCLLLAGVGATYAWGQYRAVTLRDRLRSQPAGLLDPATATPPLAAALGVPASSPPPPSPTAISSAAPAVTSSPEAPRPTEPATAQPEPSRTPSPTPAPAGPPVRIAIPDLQLDVAVTEMAWILVEGPGGTQSDWDIPQNSAGHHVNSADFDAPGNIVISGHNNIHGRVFQPISQAWDEDKKVRLDAATFRSDILNGRLIQLYSASGRRFDYRITAFYRLSDTGISLEQRQANARYIQPTSEPLLTLVTCWPPWSNTYRLVVQARPVG